MRRYGPPAPVQSDLLQEYENRCAYCRLPFGMLVWKRGIGSTRTSQTGGYRYSANFAAIVLRLEWDHFTPFTYSDSNASDQFLPACQLCNGLKSDKVYRTLEGAREALEPRWLKKYELASGPVKSWLEAEQLEAEDYIGRN